MNITMEAAKSCGKMFPNDTLFDDLLFSKMKTCEEAILERVYYFRPVKKI